MTNEQAIVELKQIIYIYTDLGKTQKEAIHFAINAIKIIELFMSNEYINRDELNKLLDELARAISDERGFISRGRSTSSIMNDMLHLPSLKFPKIENN